MKFFVQFCAFVGALAIALLISWPFVRMVDTIKACGWHGVVVECRIKTMKEIEHDD